MEPWYRIILDELAFYLNFNNYIQYLQEAIEEMEYEVSYPQTFVNDIGEIVRVQPSVEEEVIHRLERREAIDRQIGRAYERKERFKKAIEQISDKERDTLLNSNPIPDKLLQRIYIIFIKDRAAIDRDLKKEYMSQFAIGGTRLCSRNYLPQKEEA